ncbi:MAG: hypothetical protein EOR57_14170 [Mesorhizobium sp.]|uniref:hypothetical protein n=1 Tax=Mesorhizobium sp. TaxID=1871066 RepID=UPI000FE8EDB3|nr:hypothetical protein [Mesorhizobium sp.]RWL19735.1 MAG: hypothetical protein EOR57_14170 [Mesorhizobium sp.]
MAAVLSPLRSPLRSPLHSPLVGKWGASYTTEAEALFARFTTPPTAARKVLINSFIVSLKSAGVWTKLDALWIMAAADSQAARQNWKVDLYNLTAVSSPTFTTDRGFAGDGSASHLTTGFTPSTAGGQFALNSSHLGVWSRTNAQTAGVAIGARTAAGSHQSLIIIRSASDLEVHRLNQDANGASSASTDSSGDFIARRSGAAATALLRNGTSISTGTVASTALTTAGVVLGALNTGGVIGNFNNYQLAAASIGASLSDAEVTAFYNAKLAYLQAVGAA